jgi:hypothetical protein
LVGRLRRVLARRLLPLGRILRARWLRRVLARRRGLSRSGSASRLLVPLLRRIRLRLLQLRLRRLWGLHRLPGLHWLSWLPLALRRVALLFVQFFSLPGAPCASPYRGSTELRAAMARNQ